MSDPIDPNAAPATGGDPPATGDPTGTPPPPVPPAPPAAPAPAAGEPASGPKDDADYKKKFDGLQAVHQNLREQFKVIEAEKVTFATQLGELQTSLEAVRGEIGSLTTEKNEGVANLAQTQGELADYKLWERKLSRLRTTAPHLAQFEKYVIVDLPDDLLVDPATLSEEQVSQLDAAIDTAITEFSATMGAYVDSQQKAAAAGVVPPTSPGRGGEPTLEALYDLAIKAAGEDEYDGLMEQYRKLAEKKLPGSEDDLGLWRPDA